MTSIHKRQDQFTQISDSEFDATGARLASLEAVSKNFQYRLAYLEKRLSGESSGPSTCGTDELAYPPYGPQTAIGTSRVVSTSPTVSILRNKQQTVVFSVADIGFFGGATPVPLLELVCQFGGAPAASMSASPNGAAVGAGGMLKVKTDMNGDALVYITDTVAETFNLTGDATGTTPSVPGTTSITVI